ncbi:MAG: C25 family cysteine peptidase, partial [Gammaproteobacteria bacterium]
MRRRNGDARLGRIPATSAAQARAVIESKIVRSEDTPNRSPWRSRVLLVADDLCRGGVQDFLGQAFTFESEVVDSLLPVEFDRRKLHLVDYGE